MKKIGTADNGNIIVEIDKELWSKIVRDGIDSIFNEQKKERELLERSERWFTTEAHKILEPLYSRGCYTPIERLFRFNEFDGSIDQLEKISKGERPFDNITNVGKTKRLLISSAIQKYLEEKSHDCLV